MKNIMLVCAAVLLAACAVPQGGMKRTAGASLFGGAEPENPPGESENYVDEVIEVLTSPAGARVHVSDSFAGYSPVKYSVRRFWRGAPGNMTLDTVKVEALPVSGGQCVQTGFYGEASRKVASPVSLDMAACTPAPRTRSK